MTPCFETKERRLGDNSPVYDVVFIERPGDEPVLIYAACDQIDADTVTGRLNNALRAGKNIQAQLKQKAGS